MKIATEMGRISLVPLRVKMVLKYYSAGGVPEVDKQNQCKHRQLKTNMLILDLLTQD